MAVWSQYFSKHGSVNPQRMFDQGAALISSVINNAHGGKAKPIDYMPYNKKDEDIEVDADTFESLILKGAKRGR